MDKKLRVTENINATESDATPRKRNKVFDALKCFAIFMVLWGHCIQYFLSTDYWDEPLYRIIYSFHMPLFMLIVGFFAGKLIELPLKTVIFRKAKQLLLPAIVCGVIVCIPVAYLMGGG